MPPRALPSLRALLLLLATAAPLAGQPVYVNDFETGATTGWTTPPITNPFFQRPIGIGTNPIGDRSFLGDFGDQRVTFATSGLPRHDSLVVELDLYIIRSWDGNRSSTDGPDIFSITDSESGVLLRTTFTNKSDMRQAYPGPYPGGDNAAFSGATAISALGYNDGDAIYRLRLVYAHTGSSLALTLEAQLRDRFPLMSNESWAIDNVSISAIVPRPASATLVAGNAAGAPGDEVFVPIYLRDAVSVMSSGAQTIRTTLRYNASMLMPLPPTPVGRVEAGERVIDLEMPVILVGDSSIATLHFRVAVGRDTTTALTLGGSSAVGGEVLLTERAGLFRVRGLCADGGARLFRDERAVLLRMPMPNPMRERSTVRYVLAGEDDVRLELIDPSGALRATLVDGSVGAGEHAIEIAGLPAGRYTLRLRAGRELEEQTLVVVR